MVEEFQKWSPDKNTWLAERERLVISNDYEVVNMFRHIWKADSQYKTNNIFEQSIWLEYAINKHIAKQQVLIEPQETTAR